MKTITIACKGADTLPLDAIEDFQGTLKKRTKKDIEQIITSITKYGFSFPFFVWNGSGHNYCLDGHGRIQALAEMRRRGYDLPLFPVSYIEAKDEQEAKQKLLRLNSQYGTMTLESILEFADGMELKAEELSLPDGLIMQLDSEHKETRGLLRAKYIMPPMSVLSTRDGEWQDRKKQWLAMGIKSEIGRGENLVFALSAQPPGVYERKNKIETRDGGRYSWKEFAELYPDEIKQAGTSIFDPVLCEIMYTWFAPEGGVVIDPFAGGSVRGVVARHMGRRYYGHELREEQVKANRENVMEIFGSEEGVSYGVGCSTKIKDTFQGVQADFIFSCPPYADVEVYSDRDEDISNMEYDEFLCVYSKIIVETTQMLKQDRFACFVVTEIRDKKGGGYRGFVNDTVKAFEKAGLEYYNEIILVNNVGSAGIRAGKQFSASRKVVRVHQNVLVFIKGSAVNACNAIVNRL